MITALLILLAPALAACTIGGTLQAAASASPAAPRRPKPGQGGKFPYCLAGLMMI